MKYNEQTNLWESKYWHPAVTTDAVVVGFDGEELNILLIQRGIEPYKGMWALPGGFMSEDDASAEEAVRRELREETTVSNIFLEQFHCFSDADRDPRERVITIAFFAIVDPKAYRIIGGDDASEARWFPIKRLPKLAFDHNQIVKAALERMRERLHSEPIGFKLVGEEFTMPQLQKTYTEIEEAGATSPDDSIVFSACEKAVPFPKGFKRAHSLDHLCFTIDADLTRMPEPMPQERARRGIPKWISDRRNFAKKMLSKSYVKDTGKTLGGNPNRSPRIYHFDEAEYYRSQDPDDDQ